MGLSLYSDSFSHLLLDRLRRWAFCKQKMLAHPCARTKNKFLVLAHLRTSTEKTFLVLVHPRASAKKTFLVLAHPRASIKNLFFVLAHPRASITAYQIAFLPACGSHFWSKTTWRLLSPHRFCNSLKSAFDLMPQNFILVC